VDIEVVRGILAGIPEIDSVDQIEYLDKGFSADEKYVLWQGGQPALLLRLSGSKDVERRRQEFGIVSAHHERGIACPRPAAFGVLNDHDLCYSVLEYLQGESADEALPRLPAVRQFGIGLEAGRQLRRLHEMEHPDPAFEWFDRRAAKYRRKVSECQDFGLTFPGQRDIELYVESHLDILQESPVRFQHDDYHPENLIVDERRLVGMIDFNRFDWGDPVEDFYKVPWFTVAVSPSFAGGQFAGYFEGGVPEGFWERYNLLIAMNLSGSLSYAYRTGMMDWWPQRMTEIIETHDFVASGPPSWFEGQTM
jgi:aminoglycoside phosphotransferase (APT) family kinase protein